MVYEIDTWPWLSDLRRCLGSEVTLADLPARARDELAPVGTDAVWLMGVWERSPAGLAVARQDAALREAFRTALPDLAPDDEVGSSLLRPPVRGRCSPGRPDRAGRGAYPTRPPGSATGLGLRAQLDDILEQCDGVRCDMAMLLTNDVFGRTWGEHAGTALIEEFWPVVIGALRGRHPDAVLIAEAYWDMEWTLQ